MTKILSGAELAGYVKARQASEVASLRGRGIVPKLVILRDNDDPVIAKYVELKKRYGEDIGVEVEEIKTSGDLTETIQKINRDQKVFGMIVQLPLADRNLEETVLPLITIAKDVDGLNGKSDSATATAIHWLLTGYGIDLVGKKIAIVGHGRLVGAPLARMWQDSGLDVAVFVRGDDLSELDKFDVIVTATGVPRLIKSEMVRTGAVVVDAGTATDSGMIVGDVDEAVREREDLLAITPKVGGVGPLTVAVLFDNVIQVAKKHKISKI